MILVTTDIHFTDRPDDAYRFGLFNYLVKKQERYSCELVVILGDLTDKKDNHSSSLVNTICDGLNTLAKRCPVVILKGNHDYWHDPDNPFFDFLNKMTDILFISKPRIITTSRNKKLLFIPHTRDKKAWEKFKPDKKPDMAFIHQTITGAQSETGRRLDGFAIKPLRRLGCPVYSGDVHKPHTLEKIVTYVGPPYHIRFGDDFFPRCLLINEETGEEKNLYFSAPKKLSLTIRDIEELEKEQIGQGDYVKVKMELTREEVVDWPFYKNEILQKLKAMKAISFGVEMKALSSEKRKRLDKSNNKVTAKSHEEVLKGFCNKENLSSDLRKVGKLLLGKGL